MKHTVVSGIQPSGRLHIGNYFGAIQTWLKLQKSPSYKCIFQIVNYHALTEGPDPKKLEQRIFDTAVDFLAAGLDPKQSIILLQSLVPEHTDLAWILNCTTPITWLERVPTFKDKARQFKHNLNVGLLDYPVLMAADILLYNADTVPVGHDQLPHLELTREIARGFNARYGKTFIEPKEMITPTPKIMSLTDPTKKMSKSHGPKSYLALADGSETIKKKINAMVTAMGTEKEVMRLFLERNHEIHKEFQKKDDGKKTTHAASIIRSEQDLSLLEQKLGEKKFHIYMAYFNIYMLMYIFTRKTDRKRFIKDLTEGSIQFSKYKKLLADKIATYPEFVAFRKKRTELVKNPKSIEMTLKTGSKKAKRHARANMLKIKEKVGLA